MALCNPQARLLNYRMTYFWLGMMTDDEHRSFTAIISTPSLNNTGLTAIDVRAMYLYTWICISIWIWNQLLYIN